MGDVMRRCAAALLIVATFAFGVPAYANQPIPKCKNSDHLALVAGTSGKVLTAARVDVVKVDTLECRNAPGYTGGGWVIVVNGKPGMQLYPEAAAWLGGQLSATSGPVTLDHMVARVLEPYRSFDDGARAKLAAELTS